MMTRSDCDDTKKNFRNNQRCKLDYQIWMMQEGDLVSMVTRVFFRVGVLVIEEIETLKIYECYYKNFHGNLKIVLDNVLLKKMI